MNLTLERKPLLTALQQLKATAGSRTTLPILSSAHFKSNEQELLITGDNLEMRTTISTFLPFNSEEVDICLPYQHLVQLLGGFTSDEVTLVTVKQKSQQSGLMVDDLYLKSDKSKYKLLTLPGEEYPKERIVDGFTFTIEGEALNSALSEVLVAVSTDENRAILTGVLLVFDGVNPSVRFVATDTHRLVVTDRTLPEDTTVDQAREVILPPDFCKELLRLTSKGDSAEITVAGSAVRAVIGNVTVVSKVIEGKFPNYQRVIPTVTDRIVWYMSKAELIPALRRAMTIAKENSNRIIFTHNVDGFYATAESQMKGDCREYLTLLDGSISVEGGEQQYQIAFNGQYFLDAITSIEGDVFKICMTEPLKPGVILIPEVKNENGEVINKQAQGYIGVLMPMQIV